MIKKDHLSLILSRFSPSQLLHVGEICPDQKHYFLKRQIAHNCSNLEIEFCSWKGIKIIFVDEKIFPWSYVTIARGMTHQLLIYLVYISNRSKPLGLSCSARHLANWPKRSGWRRFCITIQIKGVVPNHELNPHCSDPAAVFAPLNIFFTFLSMAYREHASWWGRH